MKKLIIKWLGVDVQIMETRKELNYLQKQISYLDNRLFDIMIKQSNLNREIEELKNLKQ